MLRSKAQTLRDLSGRIRSAHVAPMVIFSFGEWDAQRETIINQISTEIGVTGLIVRSSATSEDHMEQSMAGQHLCHASMFRSDLWIAQSKQFCVLRQTKALGRSLCAAHDRTRLSIWRLLHTRSEFRRPMEDHQLVRRTGHNLCNVGSRRTNVANGRAFTELTASRDSPSRHTSRRVARIQ